MSRNKFIKFNLFFIFSIFITSCLQNSEEKENGMSQEELTQKLIDAFCWDEGCCSQEAYNDCKNQMVLDAKTLYNSVDNTENLENFVIASFNYSATEIYDGWAFSCTENGWKNPVYDYELFLSLLSLHEPVLQAGEFCEFPGQCASYNCSDNICDTNKVLLYSEHCTIFGDFGESHCAHGLYCSNNYCVYQKSYGEYCEQDSECGAEFCDDYICQDRATPDELCYEK